VRASGISRPVCCAATLAGIALVLAPAAAPGGSADRKPPSAPTIAGPQETKARTPVFRLAARDNRTPAARLRFLCAFDTQQARVCSRRPSRRLPVGDHRLTAVAVDAAGNRSRPARFLFVVLPPDAEGQVVALDEATGAVKWRMRPPMTIGLLQAGYGRVLVEGGYTCGLTKGRIMALDAASGAVAWRHEAFPGACGVGGWLGDENGVVFTRDGTAVTGLDAASGKPVWRKAGPSGGIGAYTNDADGLAIDIEGGRLVARDRHDGAPRWTAAAATSSDDLVVGPTVDGTNAYVLVWGDALEVDAFALADGHLAWKHSLADDADQIDGFSFPEGDGSGLAIAVSSGDNGYALLGLDPATGQLLWKSATDDYRAAPLVAAGTLYSWAGAADGPGRLVALDARSGAVRWQVPEDEESDPLVVDAGLVIATGVGRLEAVDAATGAARWHAPFGGGPFSAASARGGVLYAFQIGHVID